MGKFEIVSEIEIFSSPEIFFSRQSEVGPEPSSELTDLSNSAVSGVDMPPSPASHVVVVNLDAQGEADPQIVKCLKEHGPRVDVEERRAYTREPTVRSMRLRRSGVAALHRDGTVFEVVLSLVQTLKIVLSGSGRSGGGGI